MMKHRWAGGPAKGCARLFMSLTDPGVLKLVIFIDCRIKKKLNLDDELKISANVGLMGWINS